MSEFETDEYHDPEYVDELEAGERRDAIAGDVQAVNDALDDLLALQYAEPGTLPDDEDEKTPARPPVTRADLSAAFDSVSKDYPEIANRGKEVVELVKSRPDVFGTPSSRQDLEKTLRAAGAMLEQGDAATRSEALRQATQGLASGLMDAQEAAFTLAEVLDPESDQYKRWADSLEDPKDRMIVDDVRAHLRGQRSDLLAQLRYQMAEEQNAEAEREAEAQAALMMVALQKAVDRHPDAEALSYEAAKTVVGAIESGLVQVETPQDLADTVDLAFGAAREDRRTAIADDFGNQLLAKANGYIFENGRMVDPRDGSIVEGIGSLTPDYSRLSTSADDLTSRERQQVFLEQFGRTAIRPRHDFREEVDAAATRATKQAEVKKLRKLGLVK